jgi:hypothetical protein
MFSIAELPGPAVVLAGVALVAGFLVGRLTASRRRAAEELAEIRLVNAMRPPRSAYQFLTWALTTNGRTLRLLAVVAVLLLALPDSTAQAIAGAVAGALGSR